MRQVLEAAHDLLTYYHDLGSKGTLTEPQTLQAIMGLRCSGTEYFWINDMQPRMLMHPISRALMESKDLTDLKDATGNPFLQKW